MLDHTQPHQQTWPLLLQVLAFQTIAATLTFSVMLALLQLNMLSTAKQQQGLPARHRQGLLIHFICLARGRLFQLQLQQPLVHPQQVQVPMIACLGMLGGTKVRSYLHP